MGRSIDDNPGDSTTELLRLFDNHFSGAPDGAVRAPGRVELLGTDTDDAEGYVLTMAINLDARIAYRVTDRPVVSLHSSQMDSPVEFPLPDGSGPAGMPDSIPQWGRYVYGVADLLARRGMRLPGIEAVVSSSVPVGGGLSSSAALELGALQMFLNAGDLPLAPVDQALLAKQAENDYAGVNCGVLDQYSAVFGRVGCGMLLDCRSLSHVEIAIPAGVSIVVGNTNVSRELAESDYGVWKEQCLDAAAKLGEESPGIRTLRDVSPARFRFMADGLGDQTQRKRAQFIVEENARVAEMTAALVNEDRDEIGRLTAASFAGMRDLYGKTVPEMENMFESMKAAPGCIGCRQSGGGFGGCLVAYVDSSSVDRFTDTVAQEYERAAGIKGTLFAVESADGAGRISP